MTPFTQYKPWMIEQYGEPLYRIPVQLATSCPHGRCAFCTENGSKAQQTQKQQTPHDQIEAAIHFSKRRYRAKKFMLYIQAFTADLTDPKQQTTLFQCLEKFQFEAISIGTRPDCLPEPALDFLEKLKTQIEVWVELGVQTATNQTLKTINRGHDWNCSKQAIHALAQRKIHVAPHIILGLPNEASNDWKNTANELAKLPISGIKIHNLHIIKGTALANNPPPTLSHWEYAEGLFEVLQRIPPNIPVMRTSTDTPSDQLIAPKWHLEKGQFLDYIIQQMTMRELSQGQLNNNEPKKNSTHPIPFTPVPTDDGSITFFSNDWKEHYHTKKGARLEAKKKYAEPAELATKLKTTHIKLLDLCFGLGTNSLAALCEASKDIKNRGTLDITALEIDKSIVRAAAQNFQTLETDPINWINVLTELLQTNQTSIGKHRLKIRWGDARWLIQNIEDQTIDLIFHDAFSSQHCPELWTVEFFRQLHRTMKPDGKLLTYSNAAPVHGAMREAGFHIAETEPKHQMGNGTIASPTKLPENHPKPDKPNPRRSTPYRDKHLCATSKAILRQRQEALPT